MLKKLWWNTENKEGCMKDNYGPGRPWGTIWRTHILLPNMYHSLEHYYDLMKAAN